MLSPVLRIAARLATGSTYAILGYDAVRSPGPRVDMAAPLLTSTRKVVPLPADDELLVRVNAAVQVLGGVVLKTGKLQRTAAASIVASLIPTTAAGHAFWSIEDPMARKMQRTQFHKNMAMLGGLAYAICDADRGPSSRGLASTARRILRASRPT